MSVEYLQRKIVEKRETATPRWGMTVDGYTCRSGAPTRWMIRLEGEKRWRRLMCLCFSNAGSLFVKVGGQTFFVRDCDLPE